MKFRREKPDPRTWKVMGIVYIIEIIVMIVLVLGRFFFDWF